MALAGIVLYAALVGAQPSVLRAAIMGALYVMSIALGRQNSAPLTILIAAAGITAFDPQVVHDVSFQLSFAAVLGLIAMAPLLAERMQAAASRWSFVAGFPLTRPIIEVMVMSLAATAFTLPITAVNFHRVSLAAPFANLFAVPAFIAVAATSAIAGVVGMLLPAGESQLVWLAWPPAAYMTTVIHLFAALPLASVALHGMNTGYATLYYALLGGGLLLLSSRPLAPVETEPPARQPPQRPRLITAPALTLVLLLACAVVWLAVTASDSPRLSVNFLDVGQGDAMLVVGPDGHRILVDGGPSGVAITSALDRHLPFYDRRIDLVVLTHPQADHMGGLPAVLRRYQVGGVLATRFTSDTSLYSEWTRELTASGVTRVTAARGETIDLGHGARVDVLGPDTNATLNNSADLNDTSVVLRLTMGDVSLLLTGDITKEAEAGLVALGTDLRAPVLKIAHHGSQTSTSPEFLARVKPLIDIISVGEHNPVGHPSPDVLQRLAGDAVFRTDKQGDITVSTDGERVWVETQR